MRSHANKQDVVMVQDGQSTRDVHPDWCDVVEVDYQTQDDHVTWLPVAYTQFPVGADIATDDGKRYFIGYEDDHDHSDYEILRICWLRNRGNARQGFVIRHCTSKEVVIAIHRSRKWSWRFKLKYGYENRENLALHDGWLDAEHLTHALNSAMSYHLQG